MATSAPHKKSTAKPSKADANTPGAEDESPQEASAGGKAQKPATAKSAPKKTASSKRSTKR